MPTGSVLGIVMEEANVSEIRFRIEACRGGCRKKASSRRGKKNVCEHGNGKGLNRFGAGERER